LCLCAFGVKGSMSLCLWGETLRAPGGNESASTLVALTGAAANPMMVFTTAGAREPTDIEMLSRAKRMISTRLPRLRRSERGQSMIETALLLPILLLLAFNAINFGYFFFVAVNMAVAPRTGVQFSILGEQTPVNIPLPPVGPPSSQVSVSYLTYQDIRNVLPGSAGARVQVCSRTLGMNGSGASLKANCVQYGPGSETYTPAADPEAPFFVLHRVDVVYTLQPLIAPFQLPTPAGPISLTLMPTLRFHRQVSMRAMG
jgi:hypothetical protein